MTLQDYFNLVLQFIPTAATLPVGSVYNAINMARRIVAAQSDATLTLYNFDLTAGDWDYPYPTVESCQIISVRKVWLYIGNERYQLDRKPIGSYTLSGFQSWPVRWWVKENTVYYYPIPAQAYSTDWKVTLLPLTLVNASDTDSQIRYQYSDAVTMLACKYTALSDGNISLAQAYEEMYRDVLEKLPRSTL